MMYEKAAELRPEDHELAVAAATAMRQAARYKDAERWYRRAVTLKPSVSIRFSLHFLNFFHLFIRCNKIYRFLKYYLDIS